MTVAEQIRKAALGPTPKFPLAIMGWVGPGRAWEAVYDALDWQLWCWREMVDDERRLLLLFVAEALGQMDPKSI